MNHPFKFLSHIRTDWVTKRKLEKFHNSLKNVRGHYLDVTINSDTVHFKHSGHLGDLIYSIPSIYVLAKGKKIAIHLQINQKSALRKKMKHVNGNLMFTEKSIALIKPLLLQNGFSVCDIYDNQQIDFDLDLVRKYPFDYRMGHIARWYFLTFGINANLGKPWLKAAPDITMQHEIVIARSFRYNTPGISYHFLNQYPDITFVGLQDEYNEMSKVIPHLKYKKTADFLELASIIAGCKLFIGNQSSPYALAEALKVKRLLEVYPLCPNVIPEGENGFDFCYQAQFEKLIDNII